MQGQGLGTSCFLDCLLYTVSIAPFASFPLLVCILPLSLKKEGS